MALQKPRNLDAASSSNQSRSSAAAPAAETRKPTRPTRNLARLDVASTPLGQSLSRAKFQTRAHPPTHNSALTGAAAWSGASGRRLSDGERAALSTEPRTAPLTDSLGAHLLAPAHRRLVGRFRVEIGEPQPRRSGGPGLRNGRQPAPDGFAAPRPPLARASSSCGFKRRSPCLSPR